MTPDPAGARDQQSMLAFWGKARPPAGAGALWHPLACHSLDVAAVAEALLIAHSRGAHAIAAMCEWTMEDFNRLAVFLIALHDIGKFSRPFQAKAPEHWPALLGLYRNNPGPRHDALGLELLRDDQILGILEPVFPGWDDEPIEALLGAVAGHHGRPVQRLPPLEANIVCRPCRAAARAFAAAAADLLGPLPLSPPPKRMAAVVSWWLAGFANLCDWIGSATQWFAYRGGAVGALDEYWPLAQEQAGIAIRQSGLLPAQPSPARGLASLAPHITIPTPVQALAETLKLPDDSGCVLIEDATGGGKTEAALLLAHRLIAAGRADGLFIALPTMATADAMFDRLAASYRALFAADAQPSLALAHGRATLNDVFQGSILEKAVAADPEAADDEIPASAQCAAWLAEQGRRVFLAHVGVGTIDQALLGVLSARYAALRLFGLARKVLIVDEAHAYDPYMSEELDRLLTFHTMLGGSSIILSATLPQVRRRALLRAVSTGLRTAQQVPCRSDYPLVTVSSRLGCIEQGAEIRRELRRDLPVRRLSGTSQAVAALAQAARGGACGIWIRNTVDDARIAAEALRKEGIAPTLFHARFAMGDRLAIQRQVLKWFGKAGEIADRAPNGVGRILVATQVVEQSLDLDADVMVTDLAPIDLLLQRAGRLQRHPGRPRPVGYEHPELLVVSPDPVALPDAEWAADAAIGGTRFVYLPHVLWRSARALFAAGRIRVPESVRALVEAVYDEDAEELPPALRPVEIKAAGDSLAERGRARGNLLDPWKGYSERSGQWDSDVAMPTRLGEPYVAFRMAREEHGELVPWYRDDDPTRAWALSEISLRRGVAENEALPDRLHAALARLRAGWKAWQKDIPVLVMEPSEPDRWMTQAIRHDLAVRLGYGPDTGLYATPAP